MFLNDKSALKSMTVWGAAILAAAQSLEASGLLAPGTADAAVGVANALGLFLTIIGIRKAVAGAPSA